MFNKVTLSLAVAALLSTSSARHHRHHRDAKFSRHHNDQYLQFIGLDDLDDTEQLQTQESIVESEKIHGKSLNLNEQTYKMALQENNSLEFDSGTFDKVFKIKNSMEAPHAPTPLGVTMIQSESDPIWGSLGVPKIAKQDLTPEQQFEQSQRNMPAVEYKDSEDVITTANSIKKAEEIVKVKMPNPDDPKEKERLKNSAQNAPDYHLHTADEEDPETVETRESVKTVEKRMKHRFFINAREKKDYEADVAAGKISSKELAFAEDDGDEIGAKKDDEAKKQAEETATRAKQVADAEKKAGGEAAKKEGGDAKKEGGDKKKEAAAGPPDIPELTPPAF